MSEWSEYYFEMDFANSGGHGDMPWGSKPRYSKYPHITHIGDELGFERRDELRQSLSIVSDQGLIQRILKEPAMQLNYIVPEGGFPAWDIAYRLQNRSLTEKQRKALTNVYIHYQLKKEGFIE